MSPADVSRAAPQTAEPALLRVRDLEVRFRDRSRVTRAVDRLSFDLHRNEILGIVGESGSGKSVTSLALLRLVRPPGRIVGGSIDFEGADVLALSDAGIGALRGRGISMISQDPITSLNPVMTVGDQITRVICLHVEPNRRAARRLAVAALEAVEIPAAERRMEQYPHELSGGMCQRVMIAMALAPQPKLLIADEPTTALDVTIQSQILALLFQIREQRQVSIILISHDIAVVSEVADRVLVMYAGRAMEEGPVERVLEQPWHPYTQALLRSIPHLGGRTLRQRVPIIAGQVPSLTSAVQGCIFADRCERVATRCRDERPVDRQGPEGRRAACWFAGEAAVHRPEARA